jgi:hypothetical protein
MHRTVFLALAILIGAVGCGPEAAPEMKGAAALRTESLGGVGQTSVIETRPPIRRAGPTVAANAEASAAECSALMPEADPAEPISFHTDMLGLSHQCGSGTTDGDGVVALLYYGGGSEGGSDVFLRPDGSQILLPPGTCAPDALVQEQQHGFLGLLMLSETEAECALSSGGSGRRLSNPFAVGEIWADDPLGGAREWTALADSPYPTFETLVALDPKGNVRWSRSIKNVSELQALGVDRQGNTLLLSDEDGLAPDGALVGVWVDRDGRPGPAFHALARADAPDFGAGPGRVAYRLVAAVDGGLLLQALSAFGVNSAWIREFPSRERASKPVPAWLATRFDTNLHVIRGGKGYALLPLPTLASPCTQAVEVMTAEGQSCGSVSFNLDPGLCSTGQINIGYDGTVIQQYVHAMEQCAPNGRDCTCSWQFWPGYFR